MIDTRKRSFTKAVIWKVLGLIALTLVAFIITGSIKQTGFVAIIYHFLMLCLFMLHERVWNAIRWGKTKGMFIQMTGMSGAGKTTLARVVGDRLREQGYLVEVIDGDEYRSGLCNDLGFSKEDRNTNIRRLGFVSKVLARNNIISIIAAINPYDNIRDELSKLGSNVKTVYVKCDLTTLKLRDTKGLYRKALLPDSDPEKIYNFTGISDPFEEPKNPDLVINTGVELLEESARKLEDFVVRNV